MSIQATSNTYLTELTIDAPITTNQEIRYQVWGLIPNTNYTCYINDVDYSWATRQWGKNLGEPITSDESGKALFFVLHEMPFEASYSYDLENTDQNVYDLRNQQNKQFPTRNIHQTVRSMQLISASGHTITIKTRQSIWVTLGHPNRSEHHRH